MGLRAFCSCVLVMLLNRVGVLLTSFCHVLHVLIQVVMVALVISFPQMVMVYKAKESTVDPTKIQIQLQPTEMTPSEQSGTAPTEQQEQKSEDEASKSLEDQFKTAPPSPPETKK